MDKSTLIDAYLHEREGLLRRIALVDKELTRLGYQPESTALRPAPERAVPPQPQRRQHGKEQRAGL